jgi:hypothetical protein
MQEDCSIGVDLLERRDSFSRCWRETPAARAGFRSAHPLWGPPMMIKACTKMLSELGVPSSQIAYDEF